jgi:hypothetical protein
MSMPWLLLRARPLSDKGSHDDRAGPRTRADTNAGLGTVDDVCLVNRQLRASRDRQRSIALTGWSGGSALLQTRQSPPGRGRVGGSAGMLTFVHIGRDRAERVELADAPTRRPRRRSDRPRGAAPLPSVARARREHGMSDAPERNQHSDPAGPSLLLGSRSRSPRGELAALLAEPAP